MEIKTPLYSTISDKLGVTKPPLTEPVATTIPVAEASAPQPPVPSFTGTPLPKDSFASQLSDIEAQAKAIQGIVSERATTPVDPATGAPTPVPGATPTPTPKPEAVSPRDKILQNYLDLAGTDLSPQKEQMRQEAQLAQKEEQARNLGNRVIERDNWYRDKIEAVERNPDGKLRGAIEADVYELQKARSRELADLSFAYNVALGDFESAENSVNERIKDMEADIQRDINILSTAYQFMGDDLTESEKLEIDQAFQERRAQKEQDYAKELADYNDKLARGRTVTKRSTELTEIDGKKTLIDTQTGEIIKTYEVGDAELDEFETAKRVEFVDDLTSLGNHRGLNSAVGPLGVSRWGWADAVSGEKDDFIGKTENIIKTLTLNTFAEAKAKGMTFGAMSKDEWQILGDSATAISNWRETDGDGNVVGYDISEKRFKQEVDTLTSFARLDAVLKGTPPEEVGVTVLVNPNTNETEYWSLNSFGEPTLIR